MGHAVDEAIRAIKAIQHTRGDRNNTVNDKCFAIGGWLDEAGVTVDEVAPALEAAAVAATQPRSMVRRSLEDGRRNPRPLPPDEPSSASTSAPRVSPRAPSSPPQAEAADQTADVRAALQAVIDGENRRARREGLADLFRSEHLAGFHEHEDLLGRISPQKTVDRLRSASKKAAKAAAAAEVERARAERTARDAKAVRPQTSGNEDCDLGGGEGDDIRAALGAPDDWPSYPIPLGWEVDETGSIARVVEDSRTGDLRRINVAIHPWYLLRTLQNYDAETFYVELGWYNRTGWAKGVFPRSQLRSTTKIVDLADYGIDVRSTGNKNAVDWAFQCEPRLGSVDVVTTRLGWHGGDYVGGPEGAVELVDHHNDFKHWRPVGSWEGWLEGLRRLPEAPVIGLMLAAAATAPLLRFLDLDHNPLVDLSGPAGRGKTTALRVAGSGWGMPSERPGGTLRTWSSTLVGLERQAAAQHDVPFLVDDTARADKPETVRDAIYALVQGRGKMRGAREQALNGGRLETATWRLTTLSTGEGPLVDRTEAGGARARPLSITTTPVCPSLELAQVLEGAVADHYGHLGPRLAALAAERGDELKEAHREGLKWWAKVGGDTRMLSTAAAIEVAAELLLELGVPLGEGWEDELSKAVRFSKAAADQSERALDVVRDELARNPDRYMVRKCAHRGLCGPQTPECEQRTRDDWHGVLGFTTNGQACVGLFDEVLRQVLSAAGHHDLGPIEAQWRERGIVMPGTKGRKVQVKRKGTFHRVIAFSKAALAG